MASSYLCNLFIMSFYNLWYILIAAVTDFKVAFKDFMFVVCWNEMSVNCKNIFARFLFTFKLKPNYLKQIIFCVLLLVLFCCKFGCMYFNFNLQPQLFSASSLSEFDCSNISMFEEFLDDLSLMVWVRCLMISGGWFDEVLTYVKLSFGFLRSVSISF